MAPVTRQCRQPSHTAAMPEIEQQIRAAAENANRTSEATSHTLSLAGDGRRSVTRAVEGMEQIAMSVRTEAEAIDRLGARSETIGGIVKAINEIADQTNLLALNAAIQGSERLTFPNEGRRPAGLAPRVGESVSAPPKRRHGDASVSA